MAEITVAMGVGWVVSPVINLIINKTQTDLSKNYFKKADIEREMKKMETTLTEILAVMEVVEKQKIVKTNQVRLVHQIKEAVYDAEDFMDEFEYNILKNQSEKLQKKKVSQMASSSARAIHMFVVGNAKFKKKVKEVGESLNGARVSANTLKGLMPNNNSQNSATHTNENSYVTSSRLTQPDLIVGRVDECRLLKHKLKEANVSPLPTIIPIIGQGGIGKTTLVQMILNDKEVKPIFDENVWVTVSDNFDKVRLTEEILKHLSVNSKTERVNFNKLQKELEKKLVSKKVLLVLDDVWYDDKQYSNKNDWLEVLDPFKKAKKESKIILTTRSSNLESILGASTTTIDPINLAKMSDKDSWSLFKICAFANDMANQKRQVLEPIGKEIVDKLKGLPLAIRVVGDQLRQKPQEEDWKTLNNDPLIDTPDIMKILHRSYEHLPDYLKRCFAYCSIFPKDYRFERDRLIHMWIAQGFVHSKERNKLEDVGISYFKELLDRSFFQVIKQRGKEYYVMHDLMNDLACDVSKGECLIHNKGEAIKDLGSIRHLSLDPRSLFLLSDVSCLYKLRTLIVLDTYSSKIEEMNLWDKFHMLRKIRVLDVQFISEQNLTDICESKHLRYLSFRVTKHTILPDCFRNLCHLSALFLRKGRKNVEVALPESTCSMSNLILVNSSELTLKVGRYMKVESSSSLSFHVRKNCGHQLDLLGKVNNDSYEFTISGLENVTSWKETEKAQIHKKKYRRVHLEWGHVSGMDPSECNEVIESLRPNSNLYSLEIRRYPGTAWPSWLESNSLSEMRTIHLSNCKKIEMLPDFGKLQYIQVLRLDGLAAMTKLDLKCYDNGALPFLVDLQIRDMERLEKILNCPRADDSVIWSCPKLKGLGLDCFASRRSLVIADCPDLVSLPEMEIFTSLKFLAIFNCPALNSLSKKDLPVSLKLLVIGGRTHHCLEEQIRNKEGPDWDKITAISRCNLYSSIESGEHTGLMSTLDHIARFYPGNNIKGIAQELQPFKVNKDIYIDVEHSTERGSTIPNGIVASQYSEYEASSSSSLSPPLAPPADPNMLDGEIANMMNAINSGSEVFDAEFSGSEVFDAEFSGSEVDYDEEFSGSEVDALRWKTKKIQALRWMTKNFQALRWVTKKHTWA